jgi:hypothetical protein
MTRTRDTVIAPADEGAVAYFRAPRLGALSLDWRRLAGLRLGLVIWKVPLPMYSAL